MGFKEVTSLDADTIISIGKTDKKTGKKFPTSAEGYYVGSRPVESKRGKSNLHFLQTSKGNLGVWGTTDLDRKLAQVTLGNMVRITSTGTRPTPNGDMYVYKVESDSSNSIEVNTAPAANNYTDDDNESDDTTSSYDTDDSNDTDEVPLVASKPSMSAQARVQELLKNKRKV